MVDCVRCVSCGVGGSRLCSLMTFLNVITLLGNFVCYVGGLGWFGGWVCLGCFGGWVGLGGFGGWVGFGFFDFVGLLVGFAMVGVVGLIWMGWVGGI